MQLINGNGPKRKVIFTVAGACILIALTGCKRPAAAADAPASVTAGVATPNSTPVAPATPTGGPPAPAPVDYQDKGCHFQYPSNWKPKEDKDYELHLVPAEGDGSRNVTFDIPDIPAGLAWMVSLNRIENGYKDDLKKKHADVHVDSSAEQAVNGGGKARLVQSSWKVDGTVHHDVALLIMRKDQVYILTCDADEKDLPATRADFDKIAASLRWDK